MDNKEIVSAVRRFDQAWCEQICEWESLAHGVAYCSAEFPSLPEAHQLRDVWLADADAEQAYQQVEEYYRERGASCHLWVPGSGQPVEPVEALLVGKGWRREERTAMSLTRMDAIDGSADETVRILPARAMPRAYRLSLSESVAGNDDYVNAGFERLDDANHDAFLAMIDGDVAGRISYLEVGDIAGVTDFHVSPKYRDRSVGFALMAHVLQLARRLLPRVMAACISSEDQTGQSFLERCGFSEAGALVQFRRPVE